MCVYAGPGNNAGLDSLFTSDIKPGPSQSVRESAYLTH